jgi:hypothetical protein
MKRPLIQSPDADAQLKQLFKVLCDIEDVAGYTQASVCDSEQWLSIVNTAEDNKQVFCKALGGNSVQCPVWNVHSRFARVKGLAERKHTSVDPTPTPKPATTQEDCFTEVRRRKRQNSDKAAQTSKKAAPTAGTALADTPSKITTRYFSSPHWGQRMWKLIVSVRRPLHKKRRSRRISAGHPRLY